jgi:3-hydroxyisobutyrate dehydrogenase-like beta-hydroxyacid dehydrogenase
MSLSATFIGFGEAGRAFAWPGARAFDRKTDDACERPAMLAAYAAAQVTGHDDAASALAGADTVFSLVTADQALPAAGQYAAAISPGALWLDLNSVAPETKCQAAAVIEAAGGHYVDVAVMAPVQPAGRAVPLLVAGPHAARASATLKAAGFANISVAGEHVGDAAAVKMIRSVMVKGIEALSAECALAAARAGVTETVVASLDASWQDRSWAVQFDYNLDRMMAHGVRRAAELEEVAATLETLGITPLMTRAAQTHQRQIGQRRIDPPTGLAAKLAALAKEPA